LCSVLRKQFGERILMHLDDEPMHVPCPSPLAPWPLIALKTIIPSLGLSKTALVFINQTRIKIGVMYGNPETTPGGVALRFYSSVRMRVARKAFCAPSTG
jgi:hypothetical protein